MDSPPQKTLLQRHCRKILRRLYSDEATGERVELFPFDQAYVEHLRDGDPPTEAHFVSYFEQLLKIKLRARMLAGDTVDDLRQETFRRVIVALRTQGGVRQPACAMRRLRGGRFPGEGHPRCRRRACGHGA